MRRSTGGDTRLALFGDVHANLPNLEAVLGAIGESGIRNAACTGDIVLRGTQPEACVERLALLGVPTVAGNTDRKVAGRPPRHRDHVASHRPGSRSWTHHRLSESSLQFLATLPLSVRLSLGRFVVVVVHGDTDRTSGALIDAHTPDGDLVALARSLDADCVVTGHTHRPLVRRIADHLFVNPGSVGEPLAPDGLPSWVTLKVGASGLVAALEYADPAQRHVFAQPA